MSVNPDYSWFLWCDNRKHHWQAWPQTQMKGGGMGWMRYNPFDSSENDMYSPLHLFYHKIISELKIHSWLFVGNWNKSIRWYLCPYNSWYENECSSIWSNMKYDILGSIYAYLTNLTRSRSAWVSIWTMVVQSQQKQTHTHHKNKSIKTAEWDIMQPLQYRLRLKVEERATL